MSVLFLQPTVLVEAQLVHMQSVAIDRLALWDYWKPSSVCQTDIILVYSSLYSSIWFTLQPTVTTYFEHAFIWHDTTMLIKLMNLNLGFVVETPAVLRLGSLVGNNTE